MKKKNSWTFHFVLLQGFFSRNCACCPPEETSAVPPLSLYSPPPIAVLLVIASSFLLLRCFFSPYLLVLFGLGFWRCRLAPAIASKNTSVSHVLVMAATLKNLCFCCEATSTTLASSALLWQGLLATCGGLRLFIRPVGSNDGFDVNMALLLHRP